MVDASLYPQQLRMRYPGARRTKGPRARGPGRGRATKGPAAHEVRTGNRRKGMGRRPTKGIRANKATEAKDQRTARAKAPTSKRQATFQMCALYLIVSKSKLHTLKRTNTSFLKCGLVDVHSPKRDATSPLGDLRRDV